MDEFNVGLGCSSGMHMANFPLVSGDIDTEPVHDITHDV